MIFFTAGYKYQLWETYAHQLPIDLYPPKAYSSRFFQCSSDGTLIIHQGYAWDGPSGITFDTPSSMRGSLVHDVLYQAMRSEFIPRSFQKAADEELKRICIEDGMWAWRAEMWRKAVSEFGETNTDPRNSKKILRAP